MVTAFFSDTACLKHNPGIGHPESPERLQAVCESLARKEFDLLARKCGSIPNSQVLELVHHGGYVESIFDSIPPSGISSIDQDTYVSPGSGEAALRAVGGSCDAIDFVLGKEVKNAFCAFRPPGHHAERNRAGGFCLFNNIGIAARYAQVEHGIGKAAVVDIDVHHGNGTQHLFETQPTLFYASSHQFPAFPGTGAASETGVGNIVNVPLKAGTGSNIFRAAYDEKIFPALLRFDPDIILISAGFDAHIRDPLCQLELNTSDFGWVTEKIMDIAEKCCEGRVVSILEGGYDLDALSQSVSEHVIHLMNG